MVMAVQDPELRRIYAWWRDRAGSGAAIPTLSHFEEIELLGCGFLTLVEVTHQPLRFRYRLVSSEIATHLGYDMSGKPTRAIRDPAVRTYVERLYARAVRARAPLYERGVLSLGGRRWKHRTLVLPLSRQGLVVDALLVYRRVKPLTQSPRAESRNRRARWRIASS
jgi:hypothetical protein